MSHTSRDSLTMRDLETFQSFGIGEVLLGVAGICRVTDAEARQLLGITSNGDMAGILFPYLDPSSGQRVTARLRRDHPDVDANGKAKDKYLSPYGDNRHLYFSPGAGRLLTDLTAPVVLVEGEKSALAVHSVSQQTGRRLLSIATGGCWG